MPWPPRYWVTQCPVSSAWVHKCQILPLTKKIHCICVLKMNMKSTGPMDSVRNCILLASLCSTPNMYYTVQILSFRDLLRKRISYCLRIQISFTRWCYEYDIFSFSLQMSTGINTSNHILASNINKTNINITSFMTLSQRKVFATAAKIFIRFLSYWWMYNQKQDKKC